MSRAYGHPALEANRWTALAVLTFARTAMGFQFQSVGAVSPLLARGSIEAGERGAGMGLFYTMYYLGMVLLPPVAGWLQDTFEPFAALYFAAAAILATLPCYLAFWSLEAERDAPARGADQAGRG